MNSGDKEFDVDTLIGEAWANSVQVTDAQDIGLSMPSIIEIADADNLGNMPPTIANWMKIYDEFGAWFINLFMLVNLICINEKVKLSNQQASLLWILGNISSQIISVRRLVSSGLDVQAKQLLRNLTEQIDVAIALSEDATLADEFVLSDDENTSNAFWHKHVKGQKLRKLLFAKIESKLDPAMFKSMTNFFEKGEKILGATVHPSFVASQMANLASLPEKEKFDKPFSFEFLGHPTIFSERTLSYAVIYMTFYIIIGFVPSKRMVEYAEPAGSLIGPFQEHVLRGRSALVSMMIGLLPNWAHPSLRADIETLEATEV